MEGDAGFACALLGLPIGLSTGVWSRLDFWTGALIPAELLAEVAGPILNRLSNADDCGLRAGFGRSLARGIEEA